MRYIAILLSLLILCEAKGTDTITLAKPTLISGMGLRQSNSLILNAKYFRIPEQTEFKCLLDLFRWSPGYDSVFFLNCVFTPDSNKLAFRPNDAIWHPMFIFSNSKFSRQVLGASAGNLSFYQSELDGVEITKGKEAVLDMTECNIVSSLEINNASYKRIMLDKVYTPSYAEIRIDNTKIGMFYIGSPKDLTQPDIHCTNDTIRYLSLTNCHQKDSAISGEEIENQPRGMRKLTFNNCYIENLSTDCERLPETLIVFDNCTFGPKMDLTNLHVARVEFLNCPNIEHKVHISFASDKYPGQLRIINSDVENLEPNWSKQLEIYFDYADEPDVRSNIYENLLAKYKKDSKDDCYKAVDLQYKKYKQHWFIHGLDTIWWYHGYEKSLVFLWILIFLAIFTQVNYKRWEEVHATYPIVANEYSYFSEASPRIAKIKRVILHTAFIFFALKIDFDKLRVSSHTGYLVWFFVQYLVGLFCLLFVVKAVFQI